MWWKIAHIALLVGMWSMLICMICEDIRKNRKDRR